MFSKSCAKRSLYGLGLKIEEEKQIVMQEKEVKKKTKINESSIFSSKVPNCKDKDIPNSDLPGPGTYIYETIV